MQDAVDCSSRLKMKFTPAIMVIGEMPVIRHALSRRAVHLANISPSTRPLVDTTLICQSSGFSVLLF